MSEKLGEDEFEELIKKFREAYKRLNRCNFCGKEDALYYVLVPGVGFVATACKRCRHKIGGIDLAGLLGEDDESR